LNFNDFREFVAGENPHGIDDPRFGFLRDFSANGFGQGMGNPILVDTALKGIAAKSITVPSSLTTEYIASLKALSNHMDGVASLPTPAKLLLPPLPSGLELKAVVVQIFDNQFTNRNLKDRGIHHENFFNRAQGYYSSEVRDGVAKLEKEAASIHSEMAQKISNKMDIAWPETSAIIDGAEADVYSLRTGKPALAPPDSISRLVLADELARTPLSLKQNYFLLPPGTLRDSLEHADTLVHGLPRDRAANTLFKRTFSRIDAFRPNSPQGRLGKFLAEHLAVEANNEALYGGPENQERAEKGRRDAELMLDLVIGMTPGLSTARDIYELYTGENLVTGAKLSSQEQALLVIYVASAGLAHWSPRPAVNAVLSSVKKFADRLRLQSNIRLWGRVQSTAAELYKFGEKWPDAVGKLRVAASGAYRWMGGAPVNFTVGKVTANEMDFLGRAWVGADATKIFEAETGVTVFLSRDRLTQYRSAVFKQKEQAIRANLQKRLKPEGPWISNAHFDVLP